MNKGISNATLSSMAKRANQRLRQLEHDSLIESPAYKSVYRKSYSMPEIFGHTKHGELKFRTDITKLSAVERKKLESELNRSLGLKTSTTSGTKKAVKNQLAGYAKKAGWNDAVTTEQAREGLKIWASAEAQQMKKSYGSDAINAVINKMIANDFSVSEMESFLSDNQGRGLINIQDNLDSALMERGNDIDDEWDILDYI